jgi:hypothetical protein
MYEGVFDVGYIVVEDRSWQANKIMI